MKPNIRSISFLLYKEKPCVGITLETDYYIAAEINCLGDGVKVCQYQGDILAVWDDKSKIINSSGLDWIDGVLTEAENQIGKIDKLNMEAQKCIAGEKTFKIKQLGI